MSDKENRIWDEENQRYLPRYFGSELKHFPSYTVDSLGYLNQNVGGDGLSTKVVNWLTAKLWESIRVTVQELPQKDFNLHYWAYNIETAEGYTYANSVVTLFWPNVDPEVPGHIVMWPNEKAREKGRAGRITIRIGRGLKKMFPCLTDKEVAYIVDAFNVGFSPREFVVKTTKDAEQIGKVFKSPSAKYENPYTTSARKNLAQSCMRYSFECEKYHPAEAYGSGDFTLFYSEEIQGGKSTGKIGARCVVYTKPEKWICAPVYGVSEQAMDQILDYIAGENPDVKFYDYSSNWTGARLLKIKREKDCIIVPYVDVEPQIARDIEDDDDYVVIGSPGNYHLSHTCGYSYRENTKSCCCCDEIVRDDDIYNGDNGGIYCEQCYYDNHFSCECCGDFYPDEDRQDVRVGRYSEGWCSHCVRVHAVETHTGEIWVSRLTLETVDGVIISEDELEDGDFFVSDWDGEVYSINVVRYLEDGSSVSITEIEDHNLCPFNETIWVEMRSGEYSEQPRVSEEEEKEEENVE